MSSWRRALGALVARRGLPADEAARAMAGVSTMAMIVLTGTGVTVVEHGGRSASSPCGAADVLEELGVNLALPPSRVGRLATEAGITFCLAPVFHPGMRHAAPVLARWIKASNQP